MINIESMVDGRGWLVPYRGGRSFYGKAMVVPYGDDGLVLISYTTPVAVYECGKLYRVWGDWSATTGRHINSFCRHLGLPEMNKKAWLNAKVEKFSFSLIRK